MRGLLIPEAQCYFCAIVPAFAAAVNLHVYDPVEAGKIVVHIGNIFGGNIPDLIAVDILIVVCYNSIIKGRKEVAKMDNIEKALQELAKAVESNDTVERVKVTITLVKPKPNKAKPDK